DHSPEDTENKEKEFDLAAFGASGLETTFSLTYSSLINKLKIEKIVDLISNSPRRILGLKEITIKEGENANLTLFDTEQEWIVDGSTLKSKSKNNPFTGKKLKGKAIAVINKNKFFLCS
ncbi:MAG TPA: dihydroorotase, partial [Bacteroidia bacterium]|nr:dihydroorotase [Bacteroidia bacterium]